MKVLASAASCFDGLCSGPFATSRDPAQWSKFRDERLHAGDGQHSKKGSADDSAPTKAPWLELRLRRIVVRSSQQLAAHCCAAVAIHWTTPAAVTPPTARVSADM